MYKYLNNKEMKEEMKTVKRFDSHSASVKIGTLKKEAEQLKQVTELIQKVTDSINIKTAGQFSAWLNGKTNFQNARLSADALNLLDTYNTVTNLSNGIGLNLEDVTVNYQLKQSVIDAVNESYSSFYTDEEIKEKAIIEGIISDFNKLSFDSRRKIIVNRSWEIQINPLNTF
jgi:flagellar capping protein FliD